MKKFLKVFIVFLLVLIASQAYSQTPFNVRTNRQNIIWNGDTLQLTIFDDSLALIRSNRPLQFADTLMFSRIPYRVADTVLALYKDTLYRTSMGAKLEMLIYKLLTDTIIGSNPIADSCVAYFKVKHVASCSPLWLSSPDSVLVTGEFRQKDGSVAFRGNAGLNPFHNDGTLFMWYGAKAALRAGYSATGEWETGKIGDYSTAFGYNNIASGEKSLSGGEVCAAYGENSIAHGVGNITRNANTSAFGNFLVANQDNQFVVGVLNDTTTLESLFVVGIGATIGAEANGLEVYADSTVRTTGKFVEYSPEHAFGYYADNTGYPVQISSANTWYDMTDSTAIRTTGVEIRGFQNDNDTLIYDGYDDAHLYFTFTASVAGSNTQDFEMRVFNITDGAEIPGTDLFTTTGATNRTNVTILAYDKNANKGDRYIVQIRNLSAADNLQVYRYMAKINVEHYVH